MTTEYLYVGNFTADLSGWSTHAGSTPYLNNSTANGIQTVVTDQIDRNYDFDYTAVTDFSYITSITVDLYNMSASELAAAHVALSLDGSTFTEKGNVGFDGTSVYIWQSITVTSFFASLANINSCTMRLTSHRTGGTAAIGIQKARLAVNYTVPSGGSPNLVQVMQHRPKPTLKFPK